MWTIQSNDSLEAPSNGGPNRRLAGATLIAASGSLFISGVLAAGGPLRQAFPGNPQPTCVVDRPLFNSWVVSGSPSLNGVVKAADSLNLDTDHPNGTFYRWSYQMYLWLTSPWIAASFTAIHTLESGLNIASYRSTSAYAMP